MNSWQVGVAAEAFVAGQFARCGYDVSVQYGANQPEYDLIVASGDKMLKVSVKGSQDGSWGLTQSYIKNADYHGAADKWIQKHSSKTVLCLVQFRGVDLDALPRIYIATPNQIAQRLKESANGRGETILYEHHEWGPRAFGYGTIDRIPPEWKLSKSRIEEVFKQIETSLSHSMG
jgi:Holliday junction resolvase-like predicted endonuclease